MKAPKTIKTDERIFKVTTFDNEIFLCNVKRAQKELKQGNIKDLFHLWDFEWKRYSKIDLKQMQ